MNAIKKINKPTKKKVANQPPLTVEERKAILKKIAKIKNQQKLPHSVQDSIPYKEIFPDGICKVTDKYYSKTVCFFDTNYQLASNEQRQNIFEKYCDFLNYFDDSISIQLTFLNQPIDVEEHNASLHIPSQNDEYNGIRNEYKEILKDKMQRGNNGFIRMKYITFGIEESNFKTAKNKLLNIESEIINNFALMGVKAYGLNGKERLALLRKIMNPYSKDKFAFDFNMQVQYGMSTKDFIAPMSLDFNSIDTFRMSKTFGSVQFIELLASELSDRILNDYLDIDGNIAVTIHLKSIDQVKSVKFVKNKLSNVGKMKVDEQMKASRQGYSIDLLPVDIGIYEEELQKMLTDLQSRNERMYNATVLVTNFDKSPKKLLTQIDLSTRITQKNNCILRSLDDVQEKGLMSTLPLGTNSVDINRVLMTSSVAVFVPFTAQEIFMNGEAIYYGLNALSNNLLMVNRKQLKNPNGLILGTPGSGKSFSVKLELLGVYLVTADDIFICDPEGEYFPLVNALGGQVIKISANSPHHINPMDINLNYADNDSPVGFKSDFIISLCELIVGGKYGLTAEERSIIDGCVREVYSNYLNDPKPENMPILGDLLQKLVETADSRADRVSKSLELYVTGSQNIFNHRTNVDLNNRLICFDIKELNNQLRKIGMLIVQDQVWNRVTENREQNKSTRYYMDEFHLLLKEEQTAKYSAEIWKRFRKWGGIPTGITQNVKDLLSSKEIENIFDNSDFVCMLNQASGDREILSQKLNISEKQLAYVTNSEPGQGLIYVGSAIAPFINEFPTDTEIYKLLTTKLEEVN